MKAVINYILIAPASGIEMNSSSWYVKGAIIAWRLLIHLVMALVKPEKF